MRALHLRQHHLQVAFGSQYLRRVARAQQPVNVPFRKAATLERNPPLLIQNRRCLPQRVPLGAQFQNPLAHFRITVGPRIVRFRRNEAQPQAEVVKQTLGPLLSSRLKDLQILGDVVFQARLVFFCRGLALRWVLFAGFFGRRGGGGQIDGR